MDMLITVDYREKSSGIIELIRKYFDVRVSKLPFGDYCINNSITIERKSARDFLVSIIDLRLFRQIAELKRCCPKPVLLLEGDPLQTDLRFHPTAIKGALLSVQTIWQVPVIFSGSIEESAEIMGMIGRQEGRVADLLPLRGGYRPKRRKSRQLYLLQGLPAVGPQLAQRLLLHFNSAGRVMSASVQELMDVAGIGRVKARKIREILDEDYGGEYKHGTKQG